MNLKLRMFIIEVLNRLWPNYEINGPSLVLDFNYKNSEFRIKYHQISIHVYFSMVNFLPYTCTYKTLHSSPMRNTMGCICWFISLIFFNFCHCYAFVMSAQYCIGYSSKTYLKPKSHKILFAHNLFPVTQSFWNFAYSMAVILPCSLQNFKTIGQLNQMLCTYEILRDLSLRYVIMLYS